MRDCHSSATEGICSGPLTQGYFSTRSVTEMKVDDLAPVAKYLLCNHEGPELNPSEPLNKVEHGSETSVVSV